MLTKKNISAAINNVRLECNRISSERNQTRKQKAIKQQQWPMCNNVVLCQGDCKQKLVLVGIYSVTGSLTTNCYPAEFGSRKIFGLLFLLCLTLKIKSIQCNLTAFSAALSANPLKLKSQKCIGEKEM